MLLSMTGYGAGQANEQDVMVVVEIRTVNNRFLKLHSRLPDGYTALEPRVEEVVRGQVRRGSVQLNIDIRRATSDDDFQLNRELIASYYRQLQELQDQLSEDNAIRLDTLVLLPGAVQDTSGSRKDVDAHWPVVDRALRAALLELCSMREQEGAAMAKDLLEQVDDIRRCAEQIASRAYLVVDAYQSRLTERLNKLLAEHEIQVSPADVVREVGIFAERADISEEIVRLGSHLEQFSQVMNDPESGAGRKLEFLVQELLRETNTVGSKANDAEIAKHVVHIKTCIERIREMVQNVE